MMIMSNKQEKLLSPSSLNVFIRDEASWVMRYFYSCYSESNIYAIRGQLVELYVNMRLIEKDDITRDKYNLEAMLQTLTQGTEYSYEDLNSFYEWGRHCYNNLPTDKIEKCQVEIQGDLYGVKIKGIIDYDLGEEAIDLKSVNKLPNIVSRGARKDLLEAKKAENIRQQIIYSFLSHKPQSLLYVDQLGGSVLYKLRYRDYKEQLPIIKKALKKIKYLLTLKLEDVIIEIQPDEKKMNNKYSFDWCDLTREKAKEIWNL